MKTVSTQAARKQQAGLTLAETLLVLAIGALAIVGGTLLYLQATAGNKLNTGISQFTSIQSGVRSLYAGQSDYAGLDNLTMTDANAAPSDMVVGDGDIRNAWGGDVTVTVNGTETDRFDITFAEVPANACSRMITLNPGGAGGSGLVSIVVADADTGGTFDQGSGNIPVTTAEAVAACADADDSTVITWVFN